MRQLIGILITAVALLLILALFALITFTVAPETEYEEAQTHEAIERSLVR